MLLRSYEYNNVGNMAWAILKVSPETAELILARFLEWVLKVIFLLMSFKFISTAALHVTAFTLLIRI